MATKKSNKKKLQKKVVVKENKNISKKKNSISDNNIVSKKKDASSNDKKKISKVKSTKKYKSKDIATIIVLGLLIIAIVILIILYPKNIDSSSSIDQNSFLDENQIDNNIVENLSLEEFEERVTSLQSNIFRDIKFAQLEVLEPYYKDLNINKELMDACIIENDYSNPNLNLEKADIIKKITEDISLANVLGITGTPGIYLNGYLLPGYVDYNSFKEKIDFTLNDPIISFDYNNTFISDVNSVPKIYIITNENNAVSKQNTIEFINSLKNSENLTLDVKEFFTDILDSFETIYLSYESDNAKKIIEGSQIDSIPAIYIEGNIFEDDVYDQNFQSFFEQLFIETKSKGYLLNPFVMPNLVSSSGLDFVYKLIDSTVLENSNDYVIGNKYSNFGVYVFTDYDCPYCTLFEKDTQEKFIEEYVDTNKAYLVIKDFVVHETSAIFPAVFSRCAQEQGVYLETHRLLFSLKDSLGQEKIVLPIMDKYASESEYLNEQYQIILENQ
ncbi:MAG: thioredoxin domain-containing protein [Candidatus ainarchaeum sp.]|nr:thioredoxin domain-containing protein [Candidatus ainarchaeum sp.]MDD3975671.1 thioredoxin domain-containing protein [Candidatus ainarchaeum sp.]